MTTAPLFIEESLTSLPSPCLCCGLNFYPGPLLGQELVKGPRKEAVTSFRTSMRTGIVHVGWCSGAVASKLQSPKAEVKKERTLKECVIKEISS